MTTFVVTGGAGFIGSHMVDFLVGKGFSVRVIDNLSQGKREWVNEAAEFYEGDILDRELCQQVMDGASGVFHMAAMSKVAPSLDKVEFCTEQNIIGTQNVLIACRDAKVKKLVYSGSSTYSGSHPPPHVEALPPSCLTPYALSKYVGEQLCELFSRLYGLPTLSLRYFNVYGPRQPREGSYALVLGIFLDCLREGRPLEIHGSGEQRRDFVHVSDVVKANWAAFNSDATATVVNVGSGVNWSISQLANMISPNQIWGPRRIGDADHTLADLTRSRVLLGWSPSVSLEQGLSELLNELNV